MIGAAVLGAGGGSRFGGGKLWADLGGRPLIEHAVGAYASVPAVERLVVVVGAEGEELRRRADLAPAAVISCEEWSEGIAASLRAAIEALERDGCDAAVVGLGDQPLITSQVIAAVIDRSEFGVRAARATFGGAPGHPVLIPRSLFAAVADLRGDVGARDLLERAGVREIEAGHLCAPDDVDTKADLQAMRERLEALAPEVKA